MAELVLPISLQSKDNLSDEECKELLKKALDFIEDLTRECPQVTREIVHDPVTYSPNLVIKYHQIKYHYHRP